MTSRSVEQARTWFLFINRFDEKITRLLFLPCNQIIMLTRTYNLSSAQLFVLILSFFHCSTFASKAEPTTEELLASQWSIQSWHEGCDYDFLCQTNVLPTLEPLPRIDPFGDTCYVNPFLPNVLFWFGQTEPIGTTVPLNRTFVQYIYYASPVYNEEICTFDGVCDCTSFDRRPDYADPNEIQSGAFRSPFWENQDVFNQCTLNTYSVASDGTRICFHAVVTNADDTTPTATPSGGNGNESNSPTGTPSPSESSSGIGLGPNSWIQEAAMLGIYVVLVMLM